MTPLSRASLGVLPPSVRRPPRGHVATGIVHFGPGAFHRAHQASYIDTLLDHDPRWGIAAVSLRSRGTVAALAEQDGLYTVAIRAADPAYRLIDAHRAFLGPEDGPAIHRLLADPAVGLVSTTVTEKGYCFDGAGHLDLGHPDIVADLGADPNAGTPRRSVVGWIVAGLVARRAAGLPPFIVLPCDNVAANGRRIGAALAAFARQQDPDFARWIEDEVRVPCTMVDSITPASDAALYDDVAGALGVVDEAAVQREAFLQWVIEDCGQAGPDLAAAGATVTTDVSAWERAKLRILNGAHSTLAYAGLLRGATSVAEAMTDAPLAAFVARMIECDVAPVLPTATGLDLGEYARTVLARFRNPAIVHRLDQIAQDGSQKLPYRLGDTLRTNRERGRMPGGIVGALGCWVGFVVARTRAGTAIIDPAGAELAAAVAGDPGRIVDRLIAGPAAGLGWMRDDEALMAALRGAAAAAIVGDWATLLDQA